jgi:hypothetical protein
MMLCVCRGPGVPRLLPAAAGHSFVDVTPKLPSVSVRCIRGGVVAERGWAVYTLVSTVDSDEGCAPVRGKAGLCSLHYSCHSPVCVSTTCRPPLCLLFRPPHAVPTQLLPSALYSHCTTPKYVWIGPRCVHVHLCSLLLTTGMATVGFARAQAGPLPPHPD